MDEEALRTMYVWGCHIQRRVSRMDPEARDDMHSRMFYGFLAAQHLLQSESIRVPSENTRK